jgi:hypothetical protein
MARDKKGRFSAPVKPENTRGARVITDSDEPPEMTLAEGATTIEDILDPEPTPAVESDPEAIRERQKRAEESGDIKDVAASLADLDLGELEGEEHEPEGDDSGTDEGPEGDAEAEYLEVEGDPLVTVRVNGEDVTVPLSEALNGYSREKAFTEKSMKLAEERREFTREREQTTEMAESLAQRIDFFTNVFERHLSPEQLAAVGRAYVQVQAERDALETQAGNERLVQEAQLLRESLGWESEEDCEAGKDRLTQAAIDHGFSPEELSNARDHRLLVLLSEAASWRESQERASEVRGELRSTRKNTPTLRPGAQKTPVDRAKKTARKAAERLRQTGSIHDGAAAIAAMPGFEEW